MGCAPWKCSAAYQTCSSPAPQSPGAWTKQAEPEKASGVCRRPGFPAWGAAVRVNRPPSASNHVSKPDGKCLLGPVQSQTHVRRQSGVLAAFRHYVLGGLLCSTVNGIPFSTVPSFREQCRRSHDSPWTLILCNSDLSEVQTGNSSGTCKCPWSRTCLSGTANRLAVGSGVCCSGRGEASAGKKNAISHSRPRCMSLLVQSENEHFLCTCISVVTGNKD